MTKLVSAIIGLATMNLANANLLGGLLRGNQQKDRALQSNGGGGWWFPGFGFGGGPPNASMDGPPFGPPPPFGGNFSGPPFGNFSGPPPFGGNFSGMPPCGGNFSGGHPPPYGGNFSGMPPPPPCFDFGGDGNFTHGPPPPFGPPHGGDGGPLGMEVFGEFPMPNMTTITCQDSGEPICAFNPFGTQGTWVCRTLYSPWTGTAKEWSACIDPKTSIPGDTCGCCGSTCPSQCTCSCTTFRGDSGFLIVDAENRTGHNMCVPGNNSIALIATGQFNCVTTCT